MTLGARAAQPPAPVSYRRVFATPGFPTLYSGCLLSRTGQQMTAVTLVLFVLAQFHSATLAGAAVFCAIAPGLVLSPLAGALLDRRGRIVLIALDYGFAAVCMAALSLLDHSGVLSSALLLAIAGASSLTTPLSNTGTRSLYPMLLPRELWDRANALDSGSYVIATITGPALAGLTFAVAGGDAALLLTAVVFASASLAVRTTPEPQTPPGSGRGLFQDAAAGLRYVVASRSLRGLAICLSVANVGLGILIVALPLVVFDRFSGGAGLVGALWAMCGVGGVVGALLAGRIDSSGRERHELSLGLVGTAVAMLLIAVAPSVAVAAIGMVIFGASQGPIDVGLFSLRQRRTDPAWLGRAFAVSMSLNFVGQPIGSAIAGPLTGHSLTLALSLAVLTQALAATIPQFLIPDRQGEDELALGARLGG